jgi:hypothetical protein
MTDAHANLAVSAVVTAPVPATTGTSLVVTATQGARFPAVPFNATIWPALVLPTPANAEIVRVTARTADTLTIVRAQEGTTARTVLLTDQIAATITKKTLDDIEASSSYGTPWLMDQSVGRYFDNSPIGHAGATLAGAANRVDMAPMYVPKAVTVDQIGASVSTLVAASLFRLGVYESDPVTGRPTNRVLVSGDLSGAAVAFVSTAVSFQFLPGKKYWIASHHGSTCTLRTIPATACYSLGLPSNTGAGVATAIRRTTATFASGLPATWTWADSELTAAVTPPSVRFRVASIP